jgi:lipopolysaccharide transport system ATP-binding protein
MVSNDAGSYTLVKAEAAAGGAEGQPLQGYSSQRQLSTKVSGPTLAAASTPGRRVESTASACEIHPLKIQKSLICGSDLNPAINQFRMSHTVISVESLSKRFLLGHKALGQRRESYLALRDVIGHEIRDIGRKALNVLRGRQIVQGDEIEEFWALKDVSFEVKQGEVIGIIGRNGAGKSTLLKIVSRITEPTKGRVVLRGRVASLLEVGTGFHPELTGRDNIYLNGAILGMTRREIRNKFDEIVAFAEVEKFLDTPVKRYSSGMYVRLAFAVAAHLEPEILVVDEVLAVGDLEFQKKCLGKMDEVSRREGRTVLFVSHNMVAVRSLCQRALMISNGSLFVDGSVTTVVTRYLERAQSPTLSAYWNDKTTAPGTRNLRIKRVQILADDLAQNVLTMQTPLNVKIDYWVLNAEIRSHLTYHLINDNGITVLTSWGPTELAIGSYRTTCKIPGDLLNSGTYYLTLLVVENGSTVVYEHEQIASFTVEDVDEREAGWLGKEPGVVQPRFIWTSERCFDDHLEGTLA